MAFFAVQKDVPITVYVEAADEEDARERADFKPVWDKLYGKETPAVDAALAGFAVVGFPYDEIYVEEREPSDIPESMQIQYPPGAFVTDDGIVPRCDLCGGPQWSGVDDWNGDTGNHRSCERVQKAIASGHPSQL